MKSLPLNIATHVGAVLLGGALFLLLTRPSPTPGQPPPSDGPAEITREGGRITASSRAAIARLIKEQNEDRQEVEESSLTIRESALEIIAEQREERATEREAYERLLKLAHQYEPLASLDEVLLNALVNRDEEACRAIFIEWHRRDPASAFNALAIRENWLGWHLDDSVGGRATLSGVPTDELLRLAADRDRPREFRRSMLNHVGLRLARNDNLKGLSEILPLLQSPQRDSLIGTFLGSWVPDEGAAAVNFIANDMPLPERSLLLAHLSTGAQFLPHYAWTEDFAETLMQRDLALPAELVAALRKEAERSALPIEEAYDFALPAWATLDHAEEAPEPPPDLRHLLFAERDYPLLFAEGEMSSDEIEAAMAESLGSPLSDQQRRELFAHLAPHHPHRAIEWARSRLPAASLPQDTASVLAYLNGMLRADDANTIPSLRQSQTRDEPRARRALEYLDAFQAHLQIGEDDSFDHNLRLLQRNLERWTAMDPGTAEEALSILPVDHAVWTVPER